MYHRGVPSTGILLMALLGDLEGQKSHFSKLKEAEEKAEAGNEVQVCNRGSILSCHVV